MRNAYSRTPASRSHHTSLPWKWIGVIGIILFIFWFSSHFGKDTSDDSNENTLFSVSLWTGSEVYLIESKGIKKQMDSDFSLSDETATVSIVNGSVEISNPLFSGYADRATEIGYRKNSPKDTLDILRWRIWMEAQGDIKVHLKNFDLSLKKEDVVFVEQNQVYSTLYVFRWSVALQANTLNYTLSAGKRIMVAHSDILNPNLSLESLSGPIDDAIKQNPFYIARNGEVLLGSITTGSGWDILSGSSISGNLIGTGLIQQKNTSYIQIISPEDGSQVTTATIKITGKLLSNEVKKVTINEVPSTISPVDMTFQASFTPTELVTNLVYKAYNSADVLLERGVVTISTKNAKSGTDKLSPNTFPINDRDYKITSPSENPYKTTDSSVTVRWVVPKDTVKFIMVNKFRLKQYKSYSTNWQYFANMSYDTMKDGINLYEIEFYGANDELLSTQLFTIVKETKSSSTISGESR